MDSCNKHYNSHVSCVFITFLAGVITGAVLTAFTTKKTGEERYNDLKDMSNNFKSKAQKIAKEANEAWHKAKQNQMHSNEHICNTGCENTCNFNEFNTSE